MWLIHLCGAVKRKSGCNMDNFSFSLCDRCNKYAPLKNGVCIKCDREVDMPEFLKGMFDNYKGVFNDNK